MTEFIFMLTYNDVTVPNAIEIFEDVKDTGLKFIGCKDIGLPIDKLQELFRRMKKENMITFLEVVSYSEEEHFKGIETAMQVGADYIIGGMRQFTGKTLEYLREKGSDFKFFPYIGNVVDHPCILEGDVTEIIRDGLGSEVMGVHGINLLLYRYTGDVTLLLDRVTTSLKVPLIVAGSIHNFEQIDQMKQKKIWAFTIGSAIMEKQFLPEKDLREQIVTILDHMKTPISQ